MAPSSSTVSANIRTSFGGVARNLADALARLDCKPHFISAVGQGAQSFASLKADLRQDINGGFVFSHLAVALLWNISLKELLC